MIVDERFEIAGNGDKNLDTGFLTDILSGCKKSVAFDDAIKTMSPNVIVTDEISSKEDIISVGQAIRSGVKVIATAHAENIFSLKEKQFLNELIAGKYFERIVALSNRNGVGTIEGVFDENLRALYVQYI